VPPIPIKKHNEATRRRKLFDELGELQAELEPKKNRETELKNHIRSLADLEYDSDQAIVYEGLKYSVLVSAKGDKRSIPLASRIKMLAVLGAEKFCEACGITLSQAQKHLNSSQQKDFIEVEPNVETRTVKTMPRAAAKAA
jgi:hypothetical protein